MCITGNRSIWKATEMNTVYDVMQWDRSKFKHTHSMQEQPKFHYSGLNCWEKMSDKNYVDFWMELKTPQIRVGVFSPHW